MATYKVLQNIEAEDKFLGPLTLRQFIYGCITAVCLYLSFLALTRHMKLALPVLLPPAALCGILAWPWAGEQTTEIWLLAKLRFHLKPRRRLWDQSGMKDLVTITVPKKLEHALTNNLNQTEVKSRLEALAQTIDSRGWAVKNVNVNLSGQDEFNDTAGSPDRLVGLSSLPQEVSTVDVQAADDIMDEKSNPIAQHFEQMIKSSDVEHHEGVLAKMQNVRAQADNSSGSSASQSSQPWFMQPGANAAPAGFAGFATQPVTTSSTPTALTSEEEALLSKVHEHDQRMNAAFGHANPPQPTPKPTAAPKTATPDPAILKLAKNNDLNVATIARQASKTKPLQSPDDEVVVSLR